MSENSESGNRWEAGAQPAAEAAMPPVVESAEVAETPDEPTDAERHSKLPHWVNKRGLVAVGTTAAFFLGGGGVGYALGTHGHDDGGRPIPGRFDQSGLGPGRLPGGDDDFQAPQGQTQNQSQSDDASGSSFGTQS